MIMFTGLLARMVCNKPKSPPASLLFKALGTEHTTVKFGGVARSHTRATREKRCECEGREKKLPRNSSFSKSDKAIPFFFLTQFQMESNHYEMKLLIQTSSFPLHNDISQLCRQHGYSPFLWPLKLRSKIFPKRSHRNCSNFAIIEAAKVGISSLSPFTAKCDQRQIRQKSQISFCKIF